MIRYVEPSEVTTVAEIQGGMNEWIDLGINEKTKIAEFASRDVELAHKQPRDASNQTPWLFGDIKIREVAIEQCLYLARVFDTALLGEKIREGTRGEYTDSNVTLTAGARALGPTADLLLINIMSAHGISTGFTYLRG